MKKIFLVLSFWLLAFSLTLAAEIAVETKEREIIVGQEFTLAVKLTTGGASLNAIEGALEWPEHQLELIGVKEDQSIVSLWVRPPFLAGEAGRLSFAGIIPGGYAEPVGELFSAVFKTRSAGRASLTFSAARALLNDGQGTAAPLAFKNLELEIKSAPGKKFLPPALFFFGLGFGMIVVIILWRFVLRRSYR